MCPHSPRPSPLGTGSGGSRRGARSAAQLPFRPGPGDTGVWESLAGAATGVWEAKRADALIPTLASPQRALYTPSSLLATSSLSGHRPCFGHYLTCRPNGQGPWGEKACALSHPIFLVPRTSSWCSKRLGGKAALLNFEAFPASWVPRFTGYKERFSPYCLV